MRYQSPYCALLEYEGFAELVVKVICNLKIVLFLKWGRTSPGLPYFEKSEFKFSMLYCMYTTWHVSKHFTSNVFPGGAQNSDTKNLDVSLIGGMHFQSYVHLILPPPLAL